MAKREHLNIIRHGSEHWNNWRKENSEIIPDLSGAKLGHLNLDGVNFSCADLSGAIFNPASLVKADFHGAILKRANFCRTNLKGSRFHLVRASDAWFSLARLTGAEFQGADLTNAKFSCSDLRNVIFKDINLYKADLSGANLQGATLRSVFLSQAELVSADFRRANFFDVSLDACDLRGANLSRVDLRETYLDHCNFFGANLRGANMSEASCCGVVFSDADLSHSNLSGAQLNHSMLVSTNLNHANLSGCHVFGISAWDVKLIGANQTGLIIDGHGEITVDNLEIAQFIYMLLNYRKIREVISTIGEKAVLILGRFISERKEILDAIADELRRLKYLPIMFDFERIPGRDYTETIKVLAGLSKFVIADITQPKSIPQESQAIIPDFKIPFVRILQEGEKAWSMAGDLDLYDWVIKDVIEYPDKKKLIRNLAGVVDLAERKHKQLIEKKAKSTLKTISIEKLAAKDDS